MFVVMADNDAHVGVIVGVGVVIVAVVWMAGRGERYVKPRNRDDAEAKAKPSSTQAASTAAA